MENYNNQAKEYLEQLKGYDYDKNEIIEFLMDFESEKGADFGIVTTDILDEIVKQETDKGGFVRVAHFLAGIEWLNDDYYRIDGYGNAQDIKVDDLECWLKDILNGYYD